MNFQQFSRKMKETICESEILEESIFMGHNIILTESGVFVDLKMSEASCMEEAYQLIEQSILAEELYQEIVEDLSDAQVADIIREHHDVRVTDTLVESYLELASSKLFTVDEVVRDIRNIADVHRSIHNKVDFVLNDGSQIAITEDTLNRINNIFGQDADVIDYMRESTDNFLSVFDQIEE